MFNFFKKREVGQVWAEKIENPFVKRRCVKVIDIKGGYVLFYIGEFGEYSGEVCISKELTHSLDLQTFKLMYPELILK